MLLENPSTYVGYVHASWAEVDFIAEVARRTGCGLLLDVSNVYVSSLNHGREASAYIDAFPLGKVEEIHLAGFAEDCDAAGDCLLIDAHDSPVHEEVWALYRRALDRAGPVPTLIEWDNDVPSLAVLLGESRRADCALAGATDNRLERVG
jgi:uncharacterized protein (UPF0276 family)